MFLDINGHDSDKLVLPFLFTLALLSLGFVTFFFEFQILLLHLGTPSSSRNQITRKVSET